MAIENTRGAIGTFFLGPHFEERDVDGPAAGVIPPARSDVSTISVEQALSIGSVYRCVSVITASVAQMPLAVYRDGVEIASPTIIKQPNVNQSQRQFVKDTVWSLATYGNAYWRIYGEYPSYQNLEVLDPTQVTVMVDEDGKNRYYVGSDEVRSIKHLRLGARPGELKGRGPIQFGQKELAGAIKVRAFADEWFGNSGVPVGMLTTDQRLNAKDAQDLIDAWKKFVSDNGTALMQQGMRYEFLNIKPADAQFLEIQQSQTVAIARLFGVPATLLASGNEGNSNTYSNQQELFQQFLQTTLVDYLNEIEDALSSLLPRGQSVEFKEDALLRMNTETETAVAVAQVQAGLMTANEWRKGKGLPPIAKPVAETPNTNIGDNQNGTD